MNDTDALIAAYLSAVHRLSQQDIQALLNRSQTFVSRCLTHARKSGWLKIEHVFHGADLLGAAEIERLRRLVEPEGLLDLVRSMKPTSGVIPRTVHVVDSSSTAAGPRAIENRLRRFGQGAAPCVADFIRRSEVFAVTWGSTVSHVVDGLDGAPRLTGHSVRFVPVCAEPLERKSNKDTSSALVLRLHQLFQLASPPPPSLTGVPALISRRFTGAELKGIWRFVGEAASYREIFGGKSSLIASVDSLLTSVGQANRTMGFVHEELLRAGSTKEKKLTSARLGSLVVGDIGGVLLARPDLNPADRREVGELNLMWTGVKEAHLKRIARDADKARCPGVIVVAIGGADRAATIIEAIRHGIVNELIVDRQLAGALMRTLSTAPAAQRERG